MRQRLFLTAAVAALAAGIAGAGPAAAGPQDIVPATPVQFFGDDWGPRGYEREIEPYRPRRWATPDDDDEDMGLIAPQRALAIVRSMGHRPISRPRLAGRAWVVEAVGPRGQRTRLSINAYTGQPLAVRELEPAGQRFPTPPVWPDERPSFGRDTGPQPDSRESRLDNQPMRPEIQPERPQRPTPNITARAVPVPTPRPNIDGTPPLSVEPQTPFTPPAAQPPAPEPPAAALPQTQPRRIGPAPAPMPAETPPPVATPQPPSEPPAAALPQTQPRRIGPAPAPMPAETPPPVATPQPPSEPPAAALPQTPPAVAEPPAAMPPPSEPPAAAAPEAAPAESAPQPAEAAPVPAAPSSSETAQTPPAPPASESDGVRIDGRFLGPNGEPLPGGQPAPGVRQVTPPNGN